MRSNYERDDDTFDADAYTVDNWATGIAWALLGWETEPTEDTEWSGYEERTGWHVVAVMIGAWTDNTCSLMRDAAIHVEDDLPELGAQLHHAADQLYTSARLIAASPALLEACREALTAARLDEWDGAGSIRHDAFQALVAAIAQAVGE